MSGGTHTTTIVASSLTIQANASTPKVLTSTTVARQSLYRVLAIKTHKCLTNLLCPIALTHGILD